MSTSQITTTIRVSPLVAKFLAKHYNTRPFQLSAKSPNPFAAFLLNALEHYPSKQAYQEYQKLSQELTISMSRHQVEQQFGNKTLSQQKVIAFNDFVKQMFLQKAVAIMVVRVEYGMTVNRAAEQVLREYDLAEHELSLDSLVRYYYFYYKSANGQINAARTSRLTV